MMFGKSVIRGHRNIPFICIEEKLKTITYFSAVQKCQVFFIFAE